MLRSVVVAFFLSGVLFFAPVAHAQFGNVQALSLSLSPEYPRPYQTVTVTPSSSLIDLSASVVTVSVNGKPVEQGTGVQSIPVTVGGPGEKTVVSVSAKTGGQTYSTSVTVRPADVALIIEPVSSTHPFYPGASLVASQGRVRVIALADLRSAPGTRINPSSLIYTWKFGDQVLQDQSGIGRSVISAIAPVRYRDAQLTVTVTTPDSAFVAQGSTVVSPVDPLVVVYQSDPLLGPLFDRAIKDTFAMSGAESSFKAVGYYFAGTPSYSWAVNGASQGVESDISVRSAGNGTGQANLSVAVTDETKQATVQSALSVLFGNKSTNVFGF